MIISFIKWYFPAAVWAVVIFALSTNAPVELPRFTLLSADKIGHFAAYCILAVLWIAGVAKHRRWQQWQWGTMMLVVLAASLYGASIELVQATLPHRSFDYADMLANCLGALLALVIVVFMQRWLLSRYQD